MKPSPLHRLLLPRSLALIGASEQPGSIGTPITRQALLASSSVAMFMVNRKHESVFGQPCLRDVDLLPDDLDLAVVMTPWDSVLPVLTTLARKRCAGAVVLCIANDRAWPFSSRQNLLARLRRIARRDGLRVFGPASQGLILAKLGLNLSLCPALPPAGGLGFVSASGAITGVIADWCADRGIGSSALLSLGDECDIDLAECLDHFALDDGTRAVLVHIDAIRDARKFLSAARAVAQRKPIVVLHPDVELEGPRSRWVDESQLRRAAFRRAGVLQVDELDELCAAAHVDLPAWPHAGSRFAIASNGPALGLLAADAVRRSGGTLAPLSRDTQKRLRGLLPPRSAIANPLDLQRDAGAERYAASAQALAADAGIDVVLLAHHPTAFASSAEIADALTPSPSEQAPLLAAFAGAEQLAARWQLARTGIPAFATPESAVRAYALNRRHHALRAELRLTPPALLAPVRVDVPAMLAVLSQHEAIEAARQLLLHVGVELRTTAPVRARCALGVVTDGRFGRVAIAQCAESRAVELLPLDRARAARLLADSGVDQAMPDPDLRAQLQRALVGMSELALRLAPLDELVLLDPRREAGGEWAAGVVLRRGGADTPPLSIAPPPVDIDETIDSHDGRSFRLRTIHAEDEPKLREGFTKLSAEEIRMRFLYPLKSLTHELAALLTQLDYDREIALVLTDFEPPGQAALFSVVRCSLDPWRRAAEFAIVIPRELSGHGLGTLLMRRIMALAQAHGARSIFGDVLAENDAMLGLARKLGFEVTTVEDQPGVVRVERQLG